MRRIKGLYESHKSYKFKQLKYLKTEALAEQHSRKRKGNKLLLLKPILWLTCPFKSLFNTDFQNMGLFVAEEKLADHCK